MINLRLAAYLIATWYALHAALLTVLQWRAWSENSFTRLLLELPLPREVPLPILLEYARPLLERAGGYFAFYSFGRFWTPAILAIFAALVWWGMIRLTQIMKPGVFSKEEAMFAFVAALIVGWPRIIIFIPLFAVFALFSALFHAMKGSVPTSLFSPLAFAAFGTLVSLFVFPLVI